MTTSRTGFLVNFMLLATFSGATIGMAKIVTTLYALSLGANAMQVGIISAMESLGMVFLTLPAGFVIARYGARPIYFLSSLGPMLVNLLIPVFSGWLWLALAQWLIGLFIPFRIVAMNSAFLRELRHLGLSKAGWYRGALTLGLGLLGPLLGNQFSTEGQFHWAFTLISLCFGAMAVYSLSFWEGEPPSERAPAVNLSAMFGEARTLLSHRNIREPCAMEALNSATTSVFSTFIILYALQETGLSQDRAVALVVIEGIGAVMALFGLGYVLRHLSLGLAYGMSLALGVSALVLIGLSQDFIWLALAGVLLSIAAAGLHLLNMNMLSQQVQDKSKVSGLFHLASMAGGFVGALAGGLISYMIGIGPLFVCWGALILVIATAWHTARRQVPAPA
ncbi:MFS transporter [Pseudomonas sp. W22_MBD1_FP4]|uniref:MFS transporter n=1 Tax=Pseudomonas sp. W22_MBD1_FP4 TaxID=3240272 RepID=UPI003F95D5D4